MPITAERTPAIHLRRSLAPLVPIAVLLALLAGTLPVAAGHTVALGITKSNGGESVAALDDFTVSNGNVTPGLWTLRSKWGGSDKAFPAGAAAALQARGVTPLIWWSPIDPAKWWKGVYEKQQRIIKGKHDPYITQWAQAARDHGDPVIVRLAHEPNVHVFPWGEGWFTNSPKRYRKMWRHVVRIFRQVGADNVRFLWSVAKEKCRGCNPYKRYYPGKDWVDYVGFTGLNWGGYAGRPWRSMVRVYRQPMRKLRAFTRKPIIVAETASNHKNGNKARWIKKGYNRVYSKWHRIKGIVWLDSNEPKKEFGHPDWRLKKPRNGSAKEAYRRIAAKARFQGNLQ